MTDITYKDGKIGVSGDSIESLQQELDRLLVKSGAIGEQIVEEYGTMGEPSESELKQIISAIKKRGF
jgi:hypothetical protein